MTRAEHRVGQEVVAGGDDHEGHEQRVQGPGDARHAVLAQPRERDADQQREADVHRRDGRVGVEERVGHHRVVADAGEVRDRVQEAPLGEEARRRGRHHGVADERDAHGDHEHVAHEVEALVVEEVEEDQRAERHRGLAVEVDPAGEVDDRRLGRRPGLHAGLDEEAHGLLEVDQVARVGEGHRGALRIVDPTPYQPVRVVRGSEEQHLTHHVEQTVGQEARLEGTGAGQEHWYKHLNDRLGCPEGRLTTPNRNLRSACGSPAAAVLRPQPVHRGALARTRPRANEASRTTGPGRSTRSRVQPPGPSPTQPVPVAIRQYGVKRTRRSTTPARLAVRRTRSGSTAVTRAAPLASGAGAGDRVHAPVRVVPDLAQVRGAVAHELGLARRRVVDRRVGQRDEAHRVVVEPAAIARRRERTVVIEERVALAVDLALPAARQRDVRRHPPRLPVVVGERDLQAEGPAALRAQEAEQPVVVALVHGCVAGGPRPVVDRRHPLPVQERAARAGPGRAGSCARRARRRTGPAKSAPRRTTLPPIGVCSAKLATIATA